MRPGIASCLALLALVPPLSAAEWQLLRRFDAEPSGTSRGLAYGNGNLFYTVREKAMVYRLNPANGRIRASFPTPRVIGALAYDAARDLVLAATYDGDPPVLYEYDLAGTQVSERPLATDPGDRASTEIDGLELRGSEIFYSTDIGRQVYVAERATLAVLRTFPAGASELSGHAIAGGCLFSGDLPGSGYRLIRTDLSGVLLASATTRDILGSGDRFEYPPEDLAFDPDTFSVPALWLAVPHLIDEPNPIWAVEAVDCNDVCPSPPAPVSLGNTLKGVRQTTSAVYSWPAAPGFAWRVYADVRKPPAALAALVTSPGFTVGIPDPPAPVGFLQVRMVNCAGAEGP